MGLFPDSRIDHVSRSPSDNPSTEKGAVLMVNFTLNGQKFSGLNGGPQFPFTEAVSFVVTCEDQAEVDRYWEAFTSNGGSEGQCGWCKDRFGVSWQVIPGQLGPLLSSDDAAANERAMKAMLGMAKLDIAGLEAAAAGV